MALHPRRHRQPWETIDEYMRFGAVILALGYLGIVAAQLPNVPRVGALLMQVGGAGLLFTSVYFSWRSWTDRRAANGD